MTLQSPYALWDVAFQLSFAATLGLIVMATPLTTAYEQWLSRRVPQAAVREAVLFGSGDLMVTVAATLATLPILVYDFHTLSLLSLPVNLLVLPAQPAIMFSGLLVIAGGLIHPALGQAFGWLAWPFLVWTTGIVEWVAALPYAAFDTGPLPIALAVLYYLLLGAAAAYLVLLPARRTPAGAMPQVLRAAVHAPGGRVQFRASRLWAALVAALALVAVLVWFAALGQSDGRLHVTFLDVGQGDATLSRRPPANSSSSTAAPAPPASTTPSAAACRSTSARSRSRC